MRGSSVSVTNPHAQPYAFPAKKPQGLADYLTENSEYDPPTGCLLWTASLNKEGAASASAKAAQLYGSKQAARLAWTAHHGKKPENGKQLYHLCGDRRCINPHHLCEVTFAELRQDPDLPPLAPRGSIGEFKVGKRTLSAQAVYNIQTLPPPRDPSLGLTWVFRYDIFALCVPGRHRLPLSRRAQERLEVIRAVRRCGIRATRTVLPSGFIRYDLPPGITEIPFTAPPPEEYLFEQLGADEAPAAALEAPWAIAA